MEETKKNKKVWIAAAIFVFILVLAGIAAFLLNRRETAAGEKNFTLKIISQRDFYKEATEYTSNEETLGEFLRTLDFVEYEESSYGIYVKGLRDMNEDIDNQYWWCLLVDGESSTSGADEVPLTDGAVYTFTLEQGW